MDTFIWSQHMRIVRILLLGATVVALVPGTSTAQDKQVFVNVGGGPTFNFGDIGDRFDNGVGPAFGVTFESPSHRLGFQFEYAYRWFSVDDLIDIQAGRFSANHQTHQLDFNLVVNLTPADSAARVYALAGPGAYYRKVEITEYVGTGIVCDPFFYLCGLYPVEAVLGSRGGWDVGFNVGGGVGFRLAENTEFFIETRYHFVQGPKIGPEVTPLGTIDASGGSANGHYLPLTFGFRF